MHWTDLLTGAGSGATAVTLGVATLRRLLTRAAKDLISDVASDIKSDISRLEVKIASETGGNSNGLRQKLDEVAKNVGEVAKDLAELKGAFSQHTKEAA